MQTVIDVMAVYMLQVPYDVITHGVACTWEYGWVHIIYNCSLD
jgi:hypothetical protein